MLRQFSTKNVSYIKRHIQNYQQGNGPTVVAWIEGQGLSLIDDVREERRRVPSRSRRRAQLQVPGRVEVARFPKQLEVQLQSGPSWYRVRDLFLKMQAK